jgi:hypothetical protein
MLRFVFADLLAIAFIAGGLYMYWQYRQNKRVNKIEAYFSGGSLAHETRMIPRKTNIITFEDEIYHYSDQLSGNDPVYVFVGHVQPDSQMGYELRP